MGKIVIVGGGEIGRPGTQVETLLIDKEIVRLSGKKSLQAVLDKAQQVIAVLAIHGNDDESAARSAYKAGNSLLNPRADDAMPVIKEWADTLDHALPALDQLKPADKGQLVNALIATVMADDKVAVEELELLRVVCAVIHVPLPMITGGET